MRAKLGGGLKKKGPSGELLMPLCGTKDDEKVGSVAF